MKKRCLYPVFLILLSVAVLILGGCPSPIGNDLSFDAQDQPTVAVDPARGIAIFTEPSGFETVISSTEDDGIVECTSVTDFVVYDNDDTARNSERVSSPRAIILGTRSDGRPGIWIVYRGGRVIVPEGDGTDPTSELLEAVSDAGEFSWNDGWKYEARALSQDGMIIAGMAENPEATWLTDYLGTTPKVAVWWNLYKKDDGRFFLSSARVVAEYPEWDFDDVKNGQSRGRRAKYQRWMHRFFDRLGLWFFAWADDYLGDLASDEDLGDADLVESLGDGTYRIYGYDKDGVFAQAVISTRSVLNIEKTDPPGGVTGDNLPPWAVVGPIGPTFLTTGTTNDMSLDLTVLDGDGQIVIKPGPFDPDNEEVTFLATLVDIDEKYVDGKQVLPEFRVESNGVLYFTDDTNLRGLVATFTVTSSDTEVTTQYGSDQPISVFFL